MNIIDFNKEKEIIREKLNEKARLQSLLAEYASNHVAYVKLLEDTLKSYEELFDIFNKYMVTAEDQIQVMEEEITAYKELVRIKDVIIAELKDLSEQS